MRKEQAHQAVRKAYGAIARDAGGCCSASSTCGCGTAAPESASVRVGYTKAELNTIPPGADLGLGCGNPVALASIKPGETVLDLGSGGGIDCFLAAKRAGKSGRVIGIDMTPEMVDRARENARRGGYGNVEFRLGEIEHLPVADGSVDLVISNCVVNLSTNKPQTFAEAYRALKPGGRLMVSDLVTVAALPKAIKESVEAYAGCVAGAWRREAYLEAISGAGFHEVSVVHEKSFADDGWVDQLSQSPQAKAKKLGKAQVRQALASVVSIQVAAVKPHNP